MPWGPTTIQPEKSPTAELGDSGDEDLLPGPVEVLAGGRVGVRRKDQGLTQWRSAVVLPGQRVGPDGVGQRARDVDAQPAVDGLTLEAPEARRGGKGRGQRPGGARSALAAFDCSDAAVRNSDHSVRGRTRLDCRRRRVARVCRAAQATRTQGQDIGRLQVDTTPEQDLTDI